MTTEVTRPCSQLRAKKGRPALSWPAGRTHAGSSSIYTSQWQSHDTGSLDAYRLVVPIEQQGKALDYTLKRWTSLIRYAETGHLPIDSNPVENTIRPIALGKKIGYSPVPNGLVNGPLPSKRCWVQPN